MDAAQCKEHHSTCPQSVWDATTVDIHHDVKVPNTWWAAEDTQPRAHINPQLYNLSPCNKRAQPAAHSNKVQQIGKH